MSNRPKTVTVARKIRRFDKYGNPTPAVRPARFGPLCTTDCTTDCGHCKGAGRPAAPSGAKDVKGVK